MTPVKRLCGIGRIPLDRTSASAWLKRFNVQIAVENCNGGRREVVNLSDLPERERRAFLDGRIAAQGLAPGNYDDAAHTAFLRAPASQRAKAERKAEIARYLLSIRPHAGWPDRLAMVQEKFGKDGTSKPTLKRLLAQVKGTDPINFAPALLRERRKRGNVAPITRDAWSFFMTTIRDAGPDFPLMQAWRDTRDVAKARGWDWPSYPTVFRCWDALPVAQKLEARFGKARAAKLLAQPMHRDKTTLAPLEILSLDGRTLDFWTDCGDGRAVRLTMVALVDVASNMVAGWRLCQSENATDTVRLIRDTCEAFGIFDTLYTDNGSAFAGHLVAGGNPHKFRNAGSKAIQPPGICKHLGIKISFALPGNAQAKTAERTFAALSRVIDDRPEFSGAHAGHAPGAAPGAKVVPMPIKLVEQVVRREIDRHNRETGRRSQGARGRSYQQVFEQGLEARIQRRPTKRQLWLAGLIYSAVAVDRVGQMKVDGWVYGGPDTQSALLPYHGEGQRVLLGRDPEDFTAPALAFDEDGLLICEGIEHVVRGAYRSAEGAQRAARNRLAARKKAAEAEAANDYMAEHDFAEALANLPDPQPMTRPAGQKVIGGRFGGPTRDRSAADAPGKGSVPAEFLRNMDRALAGATGKGG